MHTDRLLHAETRTASIAAGPHVVFDLLADPRNLPRWAPDFARAVRPTGEDWLVDQGEQSEVRIFVRVSREHGTVDLLTAADRDLGAFMRVVPNGDGSECLFTLFFADDADEPSVTRQMATVEEELQTIRGLCEQAAERS